MADIDALVAKVANTLFHHHYVITENDLFFAAHEARRPAEHDLCREEVPLEDPVGGPQGRGRRQQGQGLDSLQDTQV